MKESSKVNKDMERLKNIQKVPAPEHLYHKIMDRMQQKKAEIVAMPWVRAAAAAVVLFISAEIVIVTNQASPSLNNSTELTNLAPNTQIQLYYE